MSMVCSYISAKNEELFMNISIERKIGDNIRRLREKIGFTQEYVATKLQLEGCDITRSALAKIEVGQRHLYPDEIIFLKKILRTNYEEIFSLNWLIAKAARINRAADFLDRRNRERRKRNGQAKVRSIEERKEGRKGLAVKDKKKPSCERTHNSVKNWKVAMPYPPGQCPDKYFRRKKA